mmetsp:Transcript_146133/g.266360  ORF Transcript_146133/g.266360 Transcript_146133/m.266360 type:complete len:445 (-) Transcript_146133:904-2238(-)
MRKLEAPQLIKVSCLSNEQLQLTCKVYEICLLLVVVPKNVVFQVGDSHFLCCCLPGLEQALLVLQNLFPKLHILLACDLTLRNLQEVRHGLKAKNWPLAAVEDAPGPEDGPSMSRRTFGDGRTLFPIPEQLPQMPDLIAILREDIHKFQGHLSVDALSRLHCLEILKQLECALRGSQILEGAIQELNGPLFNLTDTLLELCNKAVPMRCLEIIKDRLEVLEVRLQVFNFSQQVVNALGVAGHLLQLRTQELVELIKHLRNLVQVHTDPGHVSCFLEERKAIEFPPMVSCTFLDPVARDQVYLIPLFQGILSIQNDLHGLLRFHAEYLIDIDLLLNFVCNLICNSLHQWLHVLICVEIAGDDPHHADGIHQRGQRLNDCLHRPIREIFEVTFKRSEEFDVVLGDDMHLLQMCKLVVVLLQDQWIAHIQNVKNFFDSRQLQLLIDS